MENSNQDLLVTLELLQVALNESKTPHLFQIKIRELGKAKYDLLIKAGMSHEESVHTIKSQLAITYKELANLKNIDKPKHLKVLKKAARDFMQENRFPPNVGYSDGLESEISELSEQEEVSPLEIGQQYETAYILSRGIGYKASQFDQFARTWHRSYSQGSLRPNYSISAVNIGIAEYNKIYDSPLNLADYFKGKYDNNEDFTRLVEDACQKIADDFRFLRNEQLSLQVQIQLDNSEEVEVKKIAPIYLLQDIYTNDMTIFRKMIDQEQRKIFRENYKNTGHPFGLEKSAIDVLNRNGVLAKQNPETVMQLLNLLDGQHIDFHKNNSLYVEPKTGLQHPHVINYKDNPFTSTGYTNTAAYDYSIENKTYGSYLLQEFFPNYDADLIPQHPFMGKLYGFMMSEAQYNNYVAESAMNVVEQHKNRKLRVHQNIIDENEMTFIGGCIVTEKPQVKVSQYPKFKKEWESLSDKQRKDLKREYGFNKSTYSEIRVQLKSFNQRNHNPAYLRDLFVKQYAELLNFKQVPKNKQASTFGQPWTKEEVFGLIMKEALNKDVIEATLKDYGGIDDATSKACIKTLIDYSSAKKRFHALFEHMYTHMLNKYEEESVDFALKRGYKIANLSEKGAAYQEKRVLELNKASDFKAQQLAEDEHTKSSDNFHVLYDLHQDKNKSQDTTLLPSGESDLNKNSNSVALEKPRKK